jgi:hypothetical protein
MDADIRLYGVIAHERMLRICQRCGKRDYWYP